MVAPLAILVGIIAILGTLVLVVGPPDLLFGGKDAASVDRLSSEQIEYQPTNRGVLAPTEVDEIIREAATLNGISDYDQSLEWVTGLRSLIDRESGRNSDAVAQNNLGPVAADGRSTQAPRGLAALTPEVFGEHHRKGSSRNIYDPVANTAAAIGYIDSQRNGVPVGEFIARFLN